jgi:hypothetical protein
MCHVIPMSFLRCLRILNYKNGGKNGEGRGKNGRKNTNSCGEEVSYNGEKGKKKDELISMTKDISDCFFRPFYLGVAIS